MSEMLIERIVPVIADEPDESTNGLWLRASIDGNVPAAAPGIFAICHGSMLESVCVTSPGASDWKGLAPGCVRQSHSSKDEKLNRLVASVDVRRDWSLPMKWVSLALTIGVCLMSSTASKGMSSGLSDAEMLETLWRSPSDSAPLLSDSFIAEVSVAQIEAVIEDLRTRCGDFEGVRSLETENHYKILTERCEMASRLNRDARGKIVGLWFDTPIRRDVTVSSLLEEAASFDGDVAYAIYKNGELLAGREINRPLAVGSAFKLVVLAELNAMIERGEATWSDVVTLKSKHVSLSSGLLQKMPLGSPFTLHTLAAAMIAESDNTATDVLIDYIGRDRLEQISDVRPFLTTKEVFQFKADPERRCQLEG